jgi:hypothetical protein
MCRRWKHRQKTTGTGDGSEAEALAAVAKTREEVMMLIMFMSDPSLANMVLSVPIIKNVGQQQHLVEQCRRGARTRRRARAPLPRPCAHPPARPPSAQIRLLMGPHDGTFGRSTGGMKVWVPLRSAKRIAHGSRSLSPAPRNLGIPIA